MRRKSVPGFDSGLYYDASTVNSEFKDFKGKYNAHIKKSIFDSQFGGLCTLLTLRNNSTLGTMQDLNVVHVV